MDTAIELIGVSKGFGNIDALTGISASIFAGSLTGLVGPDGAGKTTLMRIMAALMTPSQGQVRIAGQDVVKEADLIHRMTGYMPQRFGLYEDLSVQQNLDLYADLRGISHEQRGIRFEQLLDFTRLEPFTQRLAGKLSGGMKQKLGLACALMSQPKVLLLDEPSVGVDPVSRQDLWKMVQALIDEGMAVVWSTAYLDEAERCDSVLLLNDGKVEYDGAPKALSARVAGRSFRITGVAGKRRQVLTAMLEINGVRDGVIQGSAVRAVVAKETDIARLSEFATEAGGTLEPVNPRFEDAFIDLLGGGPGGRSAIAEQMEPMQLDADIAVEARHLSKRFGDFVATNDVNFEVRPGEIFGLIGPNGAGKSTTFKMLCGLLAVSEGQANVVGLDLRREAATVKLQLGYMAQKFSLYGLLSVRQNLDFFSGVYGLNGALRRQRIGEMIEVFELQRYLNDSPDALPLGFKQRLALACALMHRPAVLFLDEPTSGVDPITRREFWTHINGVAEKGVTVMVTTHFMDEAEYCDRVALMYQARLIALDSPDQLKAKATTASRPDPTMEEAFIHLVEAAGVPESDQQAA